MNTAPQEVLDMEAERVESTALAVPAASQSLALAHGSAFALARLSDDEFAAVMTMAKKGRARVQEVMRAMMRENVHYGHIPGTPANRPPTLLQPGAQLLRQMFRLVAEPITEIRYGDGVTAPAITVTCRCMMHMDSLSGEVVASAEGAATSWETKYRYRDAARTCPVCGKATIIKGKAEYGGGWLCFAKRGGCGAKWADGEQAIEGQPIGKIENPDPYEYLNTLLAMAEKRATNRATIAATSSADLFTHDVPGEDGGGFEPDDRPIAPPRSAPAREPRSQAPAPAHAPAASRTEAQVKAEAAALGDPTGEPSAAWADPVQAEAIQRARKRFFAVMDEGITSGKLAKHLKSDTPTGRAKRRELLCELFQSAAVEPAEMSGGEWSLAADRLTERLRGAA